MEKKNNITQIVSQFTGISESDILMQTRKENIVRARNLVFFAEYLKEPNFSKIGSKYKKHRTTINHSLKYVKNTLQTNKQERRYITKIIIQLHRTDPVNDYMDQFNKYINKIKKEFWI